MDPQAASQLAQAQAKAREMNPALNVSADTVGDPTNAGLNGAGAMNSRTARQDMMQSLTAPGNGAQFGNNAMPAGNTGNAMAGMNNAAGQAAPATLGTSDWIMPEKQSAQAGVATNYGNVEQTQTLTGQTQQQQVRRSTTRGGFSNAMSAMAGFAGGAILGSVLRQPGSLMGYGMYPFMMGGFGPTAAFRY